MREGGGGGGRGREGGGEGEREGERERGREREERKDLYVHEFIEPILFFDPHGPKGKFGHF